MFVRVVRISFLLPSSSTALCVTIDLLTSDRSACLTGLSAQSGERKRVGGRKNKAINGTGQTATSLRKNWLRNRDAPGAPAISLKALSTRAAVNFGDGVPAELTHKFPGRGFFFSKTTAGRVRR
jgi:hypothetical protein